MKKFLMMFLSLVTVVSTSLGLVACGKPTIELKDGDKTETLTVDKNFVAPSNPTKEGYTFLGWYIDGTDTKFDFGTEIKENVVLVAKWQVNEYKITFDANGGSAVSEIKQDFGTAVSAPSNPTKTGYTFLGWFEDGATTAYAFDTIEARDVALTAKWALAPFSIEFDSDGGSAVDTITKNYGEAVTAPADPTKVGHTFLGWFEGTTEYVFDTIEARPVSLKAKWQVNKYAVNFNENGGSAVTDILDDFGTAITAPASTKLGYNLDGWFEDGSDVAYDFNTIEAREVNLTARWSKATFTISFDVNGGNETIAPISALYESAVSAPETVPTKEGYNFVGWYEAGASDAYVFNTIEARNVELIAKWAGETFHINYDVNGGNALDNATQDVIFGDDFTLAVPTHAKYEFAGWYNGTVKFTDDAVWGRTKDVTLTAHWSLIIEKEYALYKHNADYSGREENTEDLVLDGFDNITNAQIVEAMKGADLESAEDDKKMGDVVEFVLEGTNSSDPIYVVVKVKLITAYISNADELNAMINLADVINVSEDKVTEWNAYLVLTSDIDMAGKSIKKNTMPDSRPNVSNPSYGFSGTIDGAGHTIMNLSDRMFNQLGNWSGTIKNLSLINASAPIANGLGNLTIDNCYFDFAFDKLHVQNGYTYDHVIGGTFGDSANARTFRMSNTVIKITNNTGSKMYVINNFIDNSTMYIDNVILVGDNVEFSTTEITSGVSYVELDGAYTGSVEGFDASIWNVTGKHPTFNGFEVVDATSIKFAYGRFTTVEDVRVENTASFVGTVADGVTVTWAGAKDALLGKDAHGNFKLSPGYQEKVMLKGSDGKYYTIKVTLASVAINNSYELKHLMTTLAGENNYTPGGSQTIMLNGDIDMAGVTDIVYSKSPQGAGSWGFIGTFDGNGYTISNLEVPLFIHTNYACTIKNVTFKNIKEGGAVTNRSSGAILENVKFDIDADGMSNVNLFAKDNAARMALTMKDCEIKISNAVASTNIYVQGGLSPQYDKGSMSVTNVKVVTNAGNFYFGNYNSTTDLNRTGAVNETFTGSVTVPEA